MTRKTCLSCKEQFGLFFIQYTYSFYCFLGLFFDKIKFKNKFAFLKLVLLLQLCIFIQEEAMNLIISSMSGDGGCGALRHSSLSAP